MNEKRHAECVQWKTDTSGCEGILVKVAQNRLRPFFHLLNCFPSAEDQTRGDASRAQPALLNRIMQCMHVKVLSGVSGTPAPV